MTPEPVVLTGPTLPYRLADLPDPPRALLVRGELPRGPAVAIVGTRHPTPEGERFARTLAYALTREGVSVLSGGALGIDTAAHRGALRAARKTVVVAPAGFLRPYPEKNAAFFRRVVREGGTYVSLASDETPASYAAFFSRNACLVALAHVVVVVQAGLRSGAGNAASWARQLSRPLLVVPQAPWGRKARGCINELRRGAGICEGPKDVLRELDRMMLRALPPASTPFQPTLPFESEPPVGQMADGERVTAAIASGARNIDEISRVTGLTAAVIQRQILTLTLDGVLAPDPSGCLTLAPAPRPPVGAK